MRNRFTVQEIERIITFHGEDGEYDNIYNEGRIAPSDLEDAINALESNCWDNIDEREDTVICYPADSHQNYRTGDYESTQIIIKGAPKDVGRLMNYYHAKEGR